MKIFLAGPIDTQEIDFVHDYRIKYVEKLEKAGFEVIEPYTQTLKKLKGLGMSPQDIVANIKNVGKELQGLKDPYLQAILRFLSHADIKDLRNFPDSVTKKEAEAIVNRDLELLRGVDVVVAYLPKPSFGTAIEITKAKDLGKKIFVFNENEGPIPIFARHYADGAFKSFDELLSTLASLK
jgi:nucleoside 2-deoxyribosyltransferase